MALLEEKVNDDDQQDDEEDEDIDDDKPRKVYLVRIVIQEYLTP